jgi:hypothetical protein
MQYQEIRLTVSEFNNNIRSCPCSSHERICRSAGMVPFFLTSQPEQSGQPTCLERFIPGKRAPGNHRIEVRGGGIAQPVRTRLKRK